MSVCLKGKLVLPIRWKESCSSVLVGMNIEAWVGDENGEPCVNEVGNSLTHWTPRYISRSQTSLSEGKSCP